MAITFVNSTVKRIATAASTWSIVPHSSKHGGGAYVLGFNLASTVESISTIADNTTNVYKLVARSPGTKTKGGELWYLSNLSSESTRIDVTLSGLSSGQFDVAQFDGVSTGTPLEQSTVLNGAASTVHAVTQITPSVDNCLVVAFYANSGSTVAPTAFDGSFSTNISTSFDAFGYIIQTVASTATGQWRTASVGTSTGVVTAQGILASFFDTNAGAPPPTFTWQGHMPLMGLQ